MKHKMILKILKGYKRSKVDWLISFLIIFYFLIFFIERISLQAKTFPENEEIKSTIFESRNATREPDFFISGESTQLLGFYFGVGFRRVKLILLDELTITDSDGTANGIAVNLGYFWNEQVIEYERQVSIMKHTKTFSYQGDEGDKIELIQNNFWYMKYPKIKRDLYFHYGTGLQFNKMRFTGIENRDSYEDEISLGIEAGFSYFVTPKYLFPLFILFSNKTLTVLLINLFL